MAAPAHGPSPINRSAVVETLTSAPSSSASCSCTFSQLWRSVPTLALFRFSRVRARGTSAAQVVTALQRLTLPGSIAWWSSGAAPVGALGAPLLEIQGVRVSACLDLGGVPPGIRRPALVWFRAASPLSERSSRLAATARLKHLAKKRAGLMVLHLKSWWWP